MKRVLVVLVSILLAACVEIRRERPSTGVDREKLLYAVGEAGGAGRHLIPYSTIAGYLQAASGGTSTATKWLTGLDDRLRMVKEPLAVGAGENGVYMIDAESFSLFRFRWQVEDPAHADPAHLAERHGGLSHPEFTRLRILSELLEPNDLFVAPNGDLFVSDGKGAKVVQYDPEGNLIREFRDEENLKRPVGVTVDSRGLRVFVADSLYDRVIVFNTEGRSLYGIGFRGDGPGGFKNIRVMVQGRNGILYVVNGLRQQIQSYGVDGTYVGSFGSGTFTEAEGIAVDDDNRVYLSDRFNHRLLVFTDGKLSEVYGSHGIRPGEFNQPSRLAYHQGYLYVADRQNSRVQALRVVPEDFLKGLEK